MLGKSGATLTMPTYANEKITSVKLYNSSGCSKNVKIAIYSGTNVASSEQTWSTQSSSYTYSIGTSYQETTLKIQVTNAYNAQITGVEITTESTGGGGCSKSVSWTASATHGTFGTTSGSKETCSSTATDRDVTLTLTPSTGYTAPTNLSTSGTAATKQSGPTDNGDGSYSYVYRFAQNATGSCAFSASCPAKTAASITLSIAGSTSSPSGYYVGDSYTLPSSVAECSGKTFVGWSKVEISPASATKPTSNYYEKGESVTLVASQTFYAVYATASSGGGGSGSVVVSHNSTGFPTSYGTANTFTEYELEGYNFQIQQIYKNGDKMQWRADGNSNGTGTIYNNETFPGHISSIVLEYDASDGNKNHTLKIGSSANPTSGTAITPTNDGGTTYTFDCSSYSYDYFVMVNGTGAGYTASITINYGGAVTYSGYTTSCVACATPTLTFTNGSYITHVGDAKFTNTLTVSNNNLSATVTYASSSTSKAEVNSTTGEVTIKESTVDGSPVTITANRAAADDGNSCDIAVQQTYTIVIKNKIRWFANEEEITSGPRTTETFYNGTITAIPSNPSVPIACSGKSFIGWTDVAEWDSDDAPEHLYKTVQDFSSLKIRENKTFYAVFADVTPGDPISTLTQTLSYDTWSYSGTTTDMSTYRLFGNGAYVESASFDVSKLTEVHVYGGTYGGDSYKNIAVKSGSTSWATASFTSSNQNKEYTLTSSTTLSGTGTIKVVSNSGNGTSTGVRISKVEIYTMENQDVATAYVTKCCTAWDDPTMSYNKNTIAVGESDATKSLSGTTHGTLSFSSSNTSIATVDPSTGAVHAVSPGNVTITAHWTKEGAYCAKDMTFNFTITGNVTVTFDANGGTGSMASQVIPYNTATALNTMSGLTAPSGKTFVGWNTAADGSGTSYANGASVKLTTNTTLYAQWGEAYTITLHRGGSTENITVMSDEFPYTLPTGESDYCDAWTFAGWSATSVADNSESFTNVTEATTAENAHFYAVYKGNANNADAYVRITSADQLTSGSQYIFVGRNGNDRYILRATDWNSTYNNFDGYLLAESGPDYYLKATIDTSNPTARWKINGSTGSWAIQNMSNTSYYLNASQTAWYTTATSNNKYTITPNGLFWTVKSTYGSASKPYIEFYASAQRFATYAYESAALQIYKLSTTKIYKYTSTPSGGDCSVECSNSGAEFTYPSMEKSTASADFTNTVIYSLEENSSTKAYTSSNTDVATVGATTGIVHVVGTGKTTITMTQGRDKTDPSHPICGVTLSYELTVTDPSLEVVEVTADDKIIVEHDFDGITDASVDSSKTEIKGTIADDIFISKYYEAASHMKLFALYNGTEHNIDMSQLRVRSGSSSWGDHGKVQLDKLAKLKEDYPDLQLPPFNELIFWSNNEDGLNNEQLCSCVSMNIDGKTYDYEDMKEGRVPNWYHIETDGTYITRFDFNGDDALILERSTDDFSTWTVIDLFGAGTKSAPATPTGSGNGVIHTQSSTSTTSSDLNDTPGGYYWDATSKAGKILSTNRFYLTRLSSVKSGLNAVESDTASFATLGTEWTGEGIGGGKNMEDFCGSGELFSEVAQYDYAGYYTDYVEYADGWTATDNGDGTFTIQFETGKLADLACKKIQISVTDATDNTKKASVEYRVPIIVKNSTDITQSELFNKHDKDECKVCDVAIVDGGVLTKSKPTTPAQVAADRDQIYNIDVYAGGELYVPSGTEFKVNTLTVRSTGDGVGSVDVQGTLKRENTTLIHSKRFHNVGADYRWYYFSLPYDCNVSEVTFSNGDPAKHGADFEIDWYDGEQRASSQAGGNWKSIASHPDYPNVIKAGYGYTIAVEEKAGHNNVTLVFPMANFTEPTQVNVPVGNWGAGDDAVEVNHKGWNVVGNPFLTTYKAQSQLDVNGELRSGMLVCTGGGWTQTDDGINYATVPVNGGVSGYNQEALLNHNFNPFQSFIIQVGGSGERTDLAVQLKNTYKNKRSIVQRKESEYETGEKTPVWLRVNLTNANGEMDNTTLIISDYYTTDYETNKDLAKWRGTSYQRYDYPVLASLTGGHELVFNALPDSAVEASVPLTYYSRRAGRMSFELSDMYQWGVLEEVILHDKTLGINHNLLTNGKYEFESASGEVGDRFYLTAKVNRHKEPSITTNMDLLDMENVRVTVQEHNLLINGLEDGTTIYVFDMLGRLVGRRTSQGAFVSFAIPTTGVYNVRLEGKNGGVTLRAFVK